MRLSRVRRVVAGGQIQGREGGLSCKLMGRGVMRDREWDAIGMRSKTVKKEYTMHQRNDNQTERNEKGKIESETWDKKTG